MKRGLEILMICCILVASMFGISQAAATNTLFTATISTFAVSDPGKLADINLSAVKIKSITVTQCSDGAVVAQTLSIYKNFTSTQAATLVYTFAVPATVGTYVVYPFKAISTTLSSADTIDIPYFGIRSSTATAASNCKVNVTYWK